MDIFANVGAPVPLTLESLNADVDSFTLEMHERVVEIEDQLSRSLEAINADLQGQFKVMDTKIEEMKEVATAIHMRDAPTSPLAVVALNTIDGVGHKLLDIQNGQKLRRVWEEGQDRKIAYVGVVQSALADRHDEHTAMIRNLQRDVISMRHDLDAVTRQTWMVQKQHKDFMEYMTTICKRVAIMWVERGDTTTPSSEATSYGPVGEPPSSSSRSQEEQPYGAPPQGLRGGSQIFVKTLTGKTLTVNDVGSGDTVGVLKEALSEKLHLIFAQNADFYMIFGGHRLADHRTLDSYNIISGSTVWMVMRLRGGMDAGPPCNKPKQNQSF